jgi:VTC domain-containing protein
VMRLLSAAGATLFSALFLLLGAVVAHADPSFVLTQSGAGPGDRVHFSISGTESRATYSLEVDGEGVAEGSVPAGSGISGEFTMPNLGNTSESVTVEAQITQSDETTTRECNLQYLAPSQASTGPTEPQPTPVLTPAHAAHPTGPQPTSVLTSAPAAQSAPASEPAPRSHQRKRPASRLAPGKRPARRSQPHARQRHAHERRASERQHSTRAGNQRRRRGSAIPASAAWASAQSATPRSEGEENPLSTAESENGPPSGRRQGVGPGVTTGLTTFLTAPPTPAILLLATGVAGDGGGGSPIAAAIALPLLGLTALTFARGGVATRRRPARGEGRKVDDGDDRDDGDDEILQGSIYVPDDEEIEAIGARLKAGRDLDDRDRGRLFQQPQETELVSAAKQSREKILAEAMAVPLQEAAASFAPIPLAVLDRRARLATRTDRKYILDAKTFGRLVGELIPHYLILEIDDARVFPYDTVYFDTPAWTAYRQHLQGRRRRFKSRTRLYATSGLCFFEVKLKGARGKTIKRKLEHGVEEHGSLTSPALAFLERVLQKAYGASPPAALGPVLRTSYRRLTLVGRMDSERLTFDFELMFAANGREYSIQPGRILLETKTEAGRLGEANRVLQRLGVRPVAPCSKYCLGVALAHPELRDNPFRRLIRHHFDAGRHARARSRP